jgi:hypothetical protein
VLPVGLAVIALIYLASVLLAVVAILVGTNEKAFASIVTFQLVFSAAVFGTFVERLGGGLTIRRSDGSR